MPPLTQLQRNRQQRTERLRGWMLKILYEARPDPLEFVVLSSTLDEVNFGVSRSTLAIELSFLCSKKMIRVFPIGSQDELTDNEQQGLLQRCARDEETCANVCVWLRAEGTIFVEGLAACEGIQRVRR